MDDERKLIQRIRMFSIVKNKILNNYRRFIVCSTIFTIFLVYTIKVNESVLNNETEKIDPNKFHYSFLSINESVKMKEDEVYGWWRTTSRNPLDYLTANGNDEVLNAQKICPPETEPLFVLIIVSSTAQNFEARRLIRETWGNTTRFNYPLFQKMHGKNKGNYLDIDYEDWKKYTVNPNDEKLTDPYQANFKVKVVFIIGISPGKKANEDEYSIFNEQDVYGDLIQENFVENYNNLSIKTIFTLKWAVHNCYNGAKFIMKCDDDSFVNIPNLIHVLLGGTVPIYKDVLNFREHDVYKTENFQVRVNHTKHLIIGRYIHNHPVNRDSHYMWYIPRYMMANDIYPDYVSGIGYVMAFESVKALFEQSVKTPILYLEDAYMTGVVAELAGVNRTSHPLFNWDTENACSMRGMVCLHRYKFQAIVDTYNFITDPSKKCDTP